MFKTIIIFIILYFITDLLAYKYIRYIDKKERKKITKIEEERIEKMKEKMKEVV